MSDLRREGEHVAESCNSIAPKALGGCAYVLATSYPFHLSLGSLAPGNGLAFGLAVSERYTPNENWRITWSGDAVRTASGSYRLGGYTKFVHTPKAVGVVVRLPGDPPVKPRRLKLDTWVIDAFAQRTSIGSINYFGPGPGSVEDGRATFGETQTQVGGGVVLPMSGASWIGALHPALMFGVTSRAVSITSGNNAGVPSVQESYANDDAPGLDRQDPSVEFREGLRLRPSLPNGRLQLDYFLSAQQFRTTKASRSSFDRVTIDLQHRIPIYRTSASSGPRDFNGPNECAETLDSLACPPVQRSRDRSGTIGFRVLLSTSRTRGQNHVPFYFQPTLGGSDLNGQRVLASYQDSRFRAPHLFALQQSFEHSIWGPIGAFVSAEQGKVSLTRRAIGFRNLARSVTIGLTVRAGGFPLLNLSWSWGTEGNHVIGSMDTSLLGGGARPGLF